MDQRFQKLAREIPVMPAVATRVMAMVTSGQNVSFRELEDIVKVDQGLTARILKVANSAQYARQREIKDLRSAFTLMGFTTIRSLVLLVSASGMFARIRSSAFYREHWYHSILTAFLSKAIALRCRLRDIAEETFLAGLFHDIGRVPLYLSDPDGYGALIRNHPLGETLRSKEQEAFGVDHHELGAELFRQWSFPQVFVDTALEHDTANITSPHKTVIVMVTVSNILMDRAVTGKTVTARQDLLTRLLPHTCLTPEDAEGYTVGLPQALMGDPLFAECLRLYGFSEATSSGST